MIRDNRTTTTEPAGRSSGEIREEIRRTRSDLDSTVIAIEERLTAGQLFEEAWHFFRRRREESTGPGTTSRLVRDHPIPMALVGAGLGLLAVEAMGGGGEPSPRRIGGPDSHHGSGDEGDSAIKERASHVKDRASELTHSAGDTIGEVGHRAREKAHDVRERAQEVGEKVGHRVQHGARRARRGITHQMEENPLAVGAAAFALGIAAGSIFPSTRWEDETMGETRDTLLREAREAGRETWEEAKEVASTAAEAASEEADRQGLTPEGVADSVRKVARRAEESGRERAEEEGLTPERMGERLSGEQRREGHEEQARTRREEGPERGLGPEEPPRNPPPSRH